MTRLHWMAWLCKPITIEMHKWDVVARTYYIANEDWDVDFDVEDVTDEAIADVLPISYDWEFWIDSSFRFLDTNNG